MYIRTSLTSCTRQQVPVDAVGVSSVYEYLDDEHLMDEWHYWKAPMVLLQGRTGHNLRSAAGLAVAHV